MKKLFKVTVALFIIVAQAYSQNVGIGTTVPEEKLTILTTTANYGLLHTDGDIKIGTWVGNGGGYFGTKSPHPIRFFTGNSTTQMTLSTSGYFGIGALNPSIKLHVKQNIPNKAIELQHEVQDDFWTIGIGTNTLNCRFEFNGTPKAQISSFDGSYVIGSDLRLKETVEPLSSLLVKIMQLKPCMYFYKDTRNKAKNRSIGFIAQEVEKIFPEMVYDMDGGYKGVNYSAFAVIAIKAIQEQQNNIERQEQEIIEQKKRFLI